MIPAVRWGKNAILSVAIAVASIAMAAKFITPITNKTSM